MTTTAPDPTRLPTGTDRRRRRPGVAVAVALGLALVLAAVGCSSSTEGSDPTTTAAAPGNGSAPPGTDAPSGSAVPTTVGEGGSGGTTPTSEVGPLTTIELDAAEQPFVDGLVSQGSSAMTDAQARCIAGYSVRAIGVDALVAAGVTPEALASNTKSLNDVTIDEATATEMVDAFGPCELDIVRYFLDGISGSVPDADIMSCIEGRLTEDIARSLYITAISTGDGSTAMDAFLAPCTT